jgi:hypothetical protein
MTIHSEARYQSAVERNTRNFYSMYWGINKGTKETREAEIKRVSSLSTPEALKSRVGVRQNDTRFDIELGKIFADAKALTEKKQKPVKEVVKEVAVPPPIEAVQEPTKPKTSRQELAEKFTKIAKNAKAKK